MVAGSEGGDYETGPPIREGWGGAIREGRYRRTGLRVTVQDVRPDLVGTNGFIERLDRFGRESVGVRHPHLLAVYDLTQTGGAYRLIAEWSDGAPLAARLSRGSLPPPEAVAAVGDVLAGLSALHERGLFHGQVGPETVVIDGQGHGRLAELGICAAAAPPGSGEQTDVRDAARLGLHLLRRGGARLDVVRRTLEVATNDAGAGDSSRLRVDLEAAAVAAFGGGWREQGSTGSRRARASGRRRRGLRLAVLGLVVVAVAAVAIVLTVVGDHAPAPNTPLAVGTDATLAVTPASAGCNTTFAFIARGSLSGSGTLVYRWEQSDGQVTANTPLPITVNEGAFELTQAWRLQGSQKVNGTMTLHILEPVDRKISQAFTYTCP